MLSRARLDLRSRIAHLIRGARACKGIVTAPLSIALGVAAMFGLIGFVGGALQAASTWQVNPPEASDGVRIGSYLEIDAPDWFGRVEAVYLYELEEEGGEEVARPVAVAPLPPEGGPLTRADGGELLEPDRSYHLVAEGSVLNIGLSPLEAFTITREVSFNTQRSPRPLLPSDPITLSYGEEVVVQWDQPLREVEYQVRPSAETRVTILPDDPTQVRIALESYEDGLPHKLIFTGAVGANDVPLKQPHQLTFITPAFPRAAPSNSEGLLRMGQPLLLEWSAPLRRFSVESPPGVQARARVDEAQPGLGYVEFEGLAQGQEYELLVTAAEAVNGAPLAEPVRMQFRTPAALTVAEYGPADGSEGVKRGSHPYITFSKPVLDRAAVERAFQIEPAVPGSFEWESDETLIFQPEGPFDYETRVTIRLLGGWGTFRAIDGSFVEEDHVFSFVTEKERWMEVSLSQQRLWLVEGGERVFSTVVATGVRGAETPTGTYRVQYKVTTARFRGTNPSGRTYDIPDVPWVMPFWGDYAIHGAPWRTGFGSPGSNGCISLPAPADQYIYDWADVGTEVRIFH